MYKFPIKIPNNLNLIVAQPYTEVAPVDLSKALSIETKTHNGVDIVCGTPEQTWGQPCVWPFPFQGVVYDAQVDSLFGATQHAHSQIDGTDPATGIRYSLVYLHLSKVTQTKAPEEDKVIIYQQGDVIGLIGNNGYVNPPPTPTEPYNGSHLHLGVGMKMSGELNYTMVNPQQVFDVNDPFRSNFYFNNNLWFGMKNNDVVELQKRLGVYPQTGFFGAITLASVINYQKAHAISPAVGFVGAITRASLNNSV